MKIRMIAQISGSRDGVDWPNLGETLDVADGEAADMIRSGLAVDARTPEPLIETAVAPKAETRKGLTKKSLSA